MPFSLAYESPGEFDINRSSNLNERMSELHDAAYEGNLELVRRLLASGVSLDETDDGLTPLQWAVAEEHFEISKLLLEAGSDASLAGRVGPREHKLIHLLVEHGCPPQELFHPDSHPVKTTRLLLRLGASPNSLDTSGQTALYRASMKSVEATQLLLSNGADPFQRNEDGTHALHFCAVWGHAARVKRLLDAGVPPDFPECGQYRALPMACSCGHYKAARILLEHGADPNAEDSLEKAARHGSALIVRLLLSHGAKKTERALEAAQEWTPDLLSKARQYASQWGKTRYRWGMNSLGERTLEVRTGNLVCSWKDGHAEIVELLKSHP